MPSESVLIAGLAVEGTKIIVELVKELIERGERERARRLIPILIREFIDEVVKLTEECKDSPLVFRAAVEERVRYLVEALEK